MDWGPVFSAVVGAGLGTAVIQGCFAVYLTNSQTKSAARYLAIRLATSLESYARQCLKVMHDQDNYMASRGAMGSLHSKIPDFPILPDDADGWRRLRSDAMAIVFELEAAAKGHQRKLIFVRNELGDEDEAFKECHISCAELGSDAHRTAASLRLLYGFPPARDDTAESIEDALANKETRHYRYPK